MFLTNKIKIFPLKYKNHKNLSSLLFCFLLNKTILIWLSVSIKKLLLFIIDLLIPLIVVKIRTTLIFLISLM